MKINKMMKIFAIILVIAIATIISSTVFAEDDIIPDAATDGLYVEDYGDDAPQPYADTSVHDEYLTMKVGETRMLYLNSSKAVTSGAWGCNDWSAVEFISQGDTYCQIKALKEASNVIIYCEYSFMEYVGGFPRLGNGGKNFNITINASSGGSGGDSGGDSGGSSGGGGSVSKQGQCGPSAYYSLDSYGTLTIYGTGATYDAEYGGKVYFNGIEDMIRNVVVKEGITKIGKFLFEGCANLSSVDLPKGLISIGQGAFYETSLISINLPQGLQEIGIHAFTRCPIRSIVIPSSVTRLELYAFCQTSLTHVILSEGLKEIDSYAFLGCPIESIVIPSSVTKIGTGVFYNSKNQSIYFKGNAPKIYKDTFDSTDTLYYVPGTNGWTDSADYDAEKGKWNGYNLSTWELPGDINGDGAVDVQDGVLMQRILARLESNAEYLSRADLNGDGDVDVQDGVKMQRILANLE